LRETRCRMDEHDPAPRRSCSANSVPLSRRGRSAQGSGGGWRSPRSRRRARAGCEYSAKARANVATIDQAHGAHLERFEFVRPELVRRAR
jgi:hypothetical protein